MIRHGEAPFLECSSKGVKEFSAFYARLHCEGGKSIEEIYQGAKRFKDGSTGLTWKQAKGRKAINQNYCSRLYGRLWDLYIQENPELLDILVKVTGVSDIFGQPGHCCQATELWRIKKENSK